MPDASFTPWPASGAQHLVADSRGWHAPTPDYWRHWLQRPELALVPESCVAERGLHEALWQDPLRSVIPGQIEAMLDADVRENWRHFLALRDAVQRAGSIEAAWTGFFAAGAVTLPPLFLDLLVQAMVVRLLGPARDPMLWRAAELLFRRQRVQLQGGRVLAGDADTLDQLHETAGLGSMGALLKQAGATLRGVELQVLNEDTGPAFLQALGQPGASHRFVLDLTHTVQQQLPHGLVLSMNRAQSGLKALAQVLERWVMHLHGVAVQIEALSRVDDPAWRWHIGLDAEATGLLNDLYQGKSLSEARQQRLISLFRLRFADPAQQREDLRGKPVYLGLAMNAQGLLKLKPQNLWLDLPLADAAAFSPSSAP
ncbi:DUF6352 family protein [Hydrogenophaga sp. T2]|uniref:DUF6352 family protein n=1 Tax=Hydrogenophaga sp. T2 TaxID=3132823 RepID=UPI003CE7DE47